MRYYINWSLCNLPTFKLPGCGLGRHGTLIVGVPRISECGSDV